MLDIQNIRHIAQNAGHTSRNDGCTMQNVGHNTLNVCQGPNWGLEGTPPTPILEKTLVSRNDF